MRGGQERFLDGVADADELCRILVELDARSVLAGAYVLAAALNEDAGAPGEAVARYRFAERAATENGDSVTAVQYRLARALLASGSADEAAELLVNVYSDGTMSLDRETVTLPQLTARLAQARSEYEGLGVIVRGDADGAFQYVADALNACRQAGIAEMGISVRLARNEP